MTTAETRARLLDTAERLFSERGFGGTSVRGITSEAGCDLGSVRHHFGSKAGLFEAVLRRRMVPLCEERIAALTRIEQQARKRVPALEDILRALIVPLGELILHPEYGGYWTKMAGWARVESAAYSETDKRLYAETRERFLAAFGRALPDLSADEVAYRFAFVFGAQVHTLTNEGGMRGVAGVPAFRDDPEPALRRLVDFAAAGMRGPSEVSNTPDHNKNQENSE